MKKITLISASKIEPKTLAAFKKAATKKYGEIELDAQVNEAMIGGVKVIVGSKAIDMTVAGRLAQVKEQLLAQL